MHHFFAYLSRMKLIDRWGLMRCVKPENVQEHSLQVAVIAHALALIKKRKFGGRADPERVATLALFHDATEVLTGDLPTPVKYFNPEIRDAYRALEGHAAAQLLKLLPEEMRGEYEDLLTIGEDEHEAKELIKAADTLCAYIKCLEEKAAGNKEFSRAEKTLGAKLQSYAERPEVAVFLKDFVPGFTMTLDEISKPLEQNL
jgi:5'-deoxynucleotidase